MKKIVLSFVALLFVVQSQANENSSTVNSNLEQNQGTGDFGIMGISPAWQVSEPGTANASFPDDNNPSTILITCVGTQGICYKFGKRLDGRFYLEFNALIFNSGTINGLPFDQIDNISQIGRRFTFVEN